MSATVILFFVDRLRVWMFPGLYVDGNDNFANDNMFEIIYEYNDFLVEC